MESLQVMPLLQACTTLCQAAAPTLVNISVQGGIGPAGLASEDLHVLDFTDFDKPRWHRNELLCILL